MLDIHSHILPGIDDGAKDIETSIKMLKIAENEGITTIVTTPHYRRGIYENSYEDVVKEVAQLTEKLKEENIKMQLLPGQEVYLEEKVLEHIRQERVQGLQGGPYMLFELPMNTLPKEAMSWIYEIQLMGYSPILAHPERYAYIIKDKEEINAFGKEGCLFQFNGGSFTGVFGKEVQKTALQLTEQGFCDFIASDAHTAGGRAPQISAAIKIAAKKEENIENKLQKNWKNLLGNKEIQQCKRHFKKRNIFSILMRK